jgi:hypothetical protein
MRHSPLLALLVGWCIPLQGETMDADEAREIYESLVRRRKLRHPALVDLRIVAVTRRAGRAAARAAAGSVLRRRAGRLRRYREGGSGRLVVTGTRNGARERIETQAKFATSESGNASIPRLWAVRRIGELTRLIRVEGSSPVLIEEMRDLAPRFGILTEYTSYLVQEPERVATAPPPMPGQELAREQTGAAAFERARRSAKFLEAKTLQAADGIGAEAVDGMAPTTGRQMAKQVGGPDVSPQGFGLD